MRKIFVLSVIYLIGGYAEICYTIQWLGKASGFNYKKGLTMVRRFSTTWLC